MRLPDATTRERICAEALTWLLTPYHHEARVKGVGVDCAQFLVGVFGNLGLIPPETDPHYPADWYLHRDEERFLGFLMRFGQQVPEEQAGPGDVFCWRVGRCFAHGAIYLGERRVIHAIVNKGVVFGGLDEDVLNYRAGYRARVCFTINGGLQP